MDESWNFIKEAPENELALVREACNMCGLQISSSASSEQMGTCILIQYGLIAEYSYEDFLNELCHKYAIASDNLGIEDKETELLMYFLFKGIKRMDDNQIFIIASNYGFSNYKDREKLIREIEVRAKTSNKFVSKLYHLVPNIYGVDFTRIFPSDTEYIDLVKVDGDTNVEYAPVVSTLIALNNEHILSNDPVYISNYIDKIIQNDTTSNNKNKSTLSAIIHIVKSTIPLIKDSDSLIEEISSCIANAPLSVPEYLFNRIKLSEDVDPKVIINAIIYHLMEQLFPCTKNESLCYKSTCPIIEGASSTIAYFDYRFPYTRIAKHTNAYYLMPKDEIDKKAVVLFLMANEIDDAKNRLKDEDELKMMTLDCAIISHEQSIVFKSAKNVVYTEDVLIDLWKQYFEEIEKRPENVQLNDILEYLSLFVDNRNNEILMRFKSIIENLNIEGFTGFEMLKLIVQKLVSQTIDY